jgi:hypothetical protein
VETRRISLEREPRWPIVLTIIAIAGLYWSLPERLTPGPSWMVPAIVGFLLIPTVVSYRLGRAQLNLVLGITTLLVLTVAVMWCLGTLVAGLPGKRETPTELLRSAVALWISNILVFACWYWRLDGGGPHQRDTRKTHEDGAFLFPQMSVPDPKGFYDYWKPGFVDYLFVAFNTSTAFSPTDVPVLSRWAKVLMMIQSMISLGTIAILAARAINIL